MRPGVGFWGLLSTALLLVGTSVTTMVGEQRSESGAAAFRRTLPKATDLPSSYRPIQRLSSHGLFYSASRPLHRIDDGDAYHGLPATEAWEVDGKGARTQGVVYGVEDGAITSAGYLIRQADLASGKSFHGLTFRELDFPAAQHVTVDLIADQSAGDNLYLWQWHFVPKEGPRVPGLPPGELPAVTTLPDRFVVYACQEWPGDFCPRMGRHRRDESAPGPRVSTAHGDDGVIYGEAAGRLIFIEYVFQQQDLQDGVSWPAMPLNGVPIPPIDNVHVLHYAGADGAPGRYTVHMYFLPEEEYLSWDQEPSQLF